MQNPALFVFDVFVAAKKRPKQLLGLRFFG